MWKQIQTQNYTSPLCAWTSSLVPQSSAQSPVPRHWAACAAWWHTMHDVKGRHSLSVSHAGAHRAVLFSCVPAAHLCCVFELELWLCVGTEGMLCRWKKGCSALCVCFIKICFCAGKKRICLLTGCFQDFPYFFILFLFSLLPVLTLKLWQLYTINSIENYSFKLNIEYKACRISIAMHSTKLG